MDIPRAPARRGRQRLLYGGLAVLGLALATLGLRSLKPAAPSVDRAAVWIDSVQRGPLLIEVRGPGTLVPERVRWISAVTAGRVEKRLAEPGQEVNPETELLELSNPDVQLEALESERQLTVAQGDRVNLRTSLETTRLNQEGNVAAAKSAYLDAKRTAEASSDLAKKELISSMEASRAQDRVVELQTRYEVEEKRLAVMTEATDSQLRLQDAQVARLRAVVDFQRERIRSMKVLAGAHGILQELPLEVGQWAQSGAVLARLVEPGRLKAVLRIPETQAKDLTLGQPAAIDTRNGIVKGAVARIDPAVQNGTVTVDVRLEGEMPRGARPDLSVDGTIQVERLDNVLHVGRPAYGQANSTVGLFKLAADGREATRVNVRLGRTSVNTVEVLGGLQPGEKVIISDMSRWDGVDRVRVE
ncbi:MAG TPA: HlyD family efflux transporter periplasmic adaptor subunit [Gemmatimonadales bacterium]|nr:HlyD family efflux transporter periplasmic adaptor subunit [Gemmatimonadales bacterium]